MRLHNLSLVLRHLSDGGPRSRAAIAADLGFNKATASSLIRELGERGLVRELGKQVGRFGRPGRLVELDGSGHGAIGLEINVDVLSGVSRDLGRRPIQSLHQPFDAARASPERTLSALFDLVHRLLADLRRDGRAPVGIAIAVPGLIDVLHGVVTLAPNLHPGWRNLPLRELLRRHLGDPGYPILIENDANLSALAEFREGIEAGTRNLVYVTGEFGVGGGVIVDGRLMRGSQGFSGEVGHLQLDPTGPRCGCGRRGCWEALVGLGALRRALSGSEPGSIGVADQERLTAEVVRRAREGDRLALDCLAEIGRWLGAGLSILVNLLNPEVVVLGGYFVAVAPWILDPAMSLLRDRALAPDGGGCRIALSTMGFDAAVLGGSGLIIDQALADPRLLVGRALQPPA